MDINFDRVCRVCLNEGVMMSIFKVSVSKKIMACAEVQVWQNDGLPTQICTKCSANLHIAFQFKRLCEKSDSKLRQTLQKSKDDEAQKEVLMECAAEQSVQIVEQSAIEVPATETQSCIFLECTPLIEVDNITQQPKFSNSNFTTTTTTAMPLTQNYTFGIQPQNTLHTLVGYNMQGYNQQTSVYTMSLQNGNLEPQTDQLTNITQQNPIVINDQPSLLLDATSKVDLNEEKQKSKGKEHFQCVVCNKNFVNATKLSRHSKTHSKDMPYKCKVCNKSFPHSGNYKIHLRMHTGERPYRCTVCNKGCRQAQDLEKHMRTHTGERPHKCTLCTRAFSTSSNLIAHIRTHTGERPYVCLMCQKAFCQSNELTKHMRTHTGEKSHVCDVCHKGFNGSSSLIVHKRSHTGEKPYVCKYCNKAFAQSSCLMVHLKRHNGEKKFTCTVCKKLFVTNTELKEHLRTHNVTCVTFVCSVCSESFDDLHDLETHSDSHKSNNV